MYRIQPVHPNRPQRVDTEAPEPNAKTSLPVRFRPSASEARAARAFYRRALRGRLLPPAVGGRSLVFMIGDTVVEARPDLGPDAPPIMVAIDDPDTAAQRCWDAGFTVRVGEDSTGQSPVSVIDPFGRRIDLTTTRTACVVNREAS